MSYYFNANEIFEVGEQIERNGKVFYEAAAVGAADEGVKALCRELASWEAKHVQVFESLRRALPAEAREGGVFDPSDEIQAYVKSAADDHVFLKNKDPKALALACRTARDILDVALTFEKDSVVFYTAMMRIVPQHQGRDRIDALVEEELKHIQILSKHREELDK